MSANFIGSPGLYGLVLAGGSGSRLGCDKGTVDYHGEPQVTWAMRLLAPWCVRCFVSIRPDQVGQGPYRELPSIIDEDSRDGPATGLRAATAQFPNVAWLVIAADMPLLDGESLGRLVAQRDATLLATAYRHADGTPEPLCAIWEPLVATRLSTAVERGGVSLRRLLEEGPVKLLDATQAGRLANANTPAEAARMRQAIAPRESREH